jgi:hypothetical protein
LNLPLLQITDPVERPVEIGRIAFKIDHTAPDGESLLGFHLTRKADLPGLLADAGRKLLRHHERKHFTPRN